MRQRAGSNHDRWVASAFSELDQELSRFPGHRLFTVLAIDWSRNENRRIYTSAPQAYPCGGAKPLRRDSQYFQEVVTAGKARFCLEPEACRRAFADFDLLERLGCESAVNVPIRNGGATIGSLNLLHESGWYRLDMESALMPFADAAAPILLRNLHQE
jgi:GAF domain